MVGVHRENGRIAPAHQPSPEKTSSPGVITGTGSHDFSMKISRRSHLNKDIERVGGKLVLALGLREGSRTIAE